LAEYRYMLAAPEDSRASAAAAGPADG